MRTAALDRVAGDLGDLLARHKRGRELRDFERYVGDPVGFVRDVLGGRPWNRQVEIATAVRDAPLVVVRGCNASGKDWTAARLALWWCYARRGLVLVTGPTERQVREVVFGEIARAWAGAPDLPGELFSSALRLGREESAGILGFTSTEASRLTGFHAPNVFAVLTEAQGVEDFAWEGVLACATGPEDRVLAVGNPLVPSGRFYTVSQDASGWRAIRIPAEEHPNVDAGSDTFIPGGPSQAFVDRMAAEYGRDSGIFRARVEGEFPDAGEDSLFRRSWIEAAVERWRDEDAAEPGVRDELVVAVDPARFGPDATAICVRRGQRIEEIITVYGRLDLMEAVERVRKVLERVGVTPGAGGGTGRRLTWGRPAYGRPKRPAAQGKVVVDEIGLGGGLLDRLRELSYRADGFHGGKAARNADRFFNRRAEAYWHLRELLEAGELALPPDEELATELLATRWRPTVDGRTQLPAKEEIRTGLGRSPDRADALVMAIAESKRRLPLVWGT